MPSICLNNCRIATVTNIGPVETDLTFVDCSGNTITTQITPNEQSLINFCNTYSFSGSTLEDLKFSDFFKPFSTYYFSSCCESNETYTIYGNENFISLGDSLFGDSYILSETGEELDLRCTLVTGKSFSKVLPPPTNNYISFIHNFNSYSELGCQQCLPNNPCISDCYKLYSCDGNITPFTTNNPSMSGYVDDYVVLTIYDPEPNENLCFFVKYVGKEVCEETYEYDITEGECNCKDCECYSFSLPEAVIETTYITCDNEEFFGYLPTGKTINICSKVRPYFGTRTPIGIRLGGLCQNGECPLDQTTIEPRNECDVLTIFPMEVNCSVIHPTSNDSFNGAATLLITGGTSPYQITWSNGSVAPLIYNLNSGEYNATVIDYYGDFTAYTTCVLTAETTTTTTSTTTLPPVVYPDLCMTLRIFKGKGKEIVVTLEQIQFEYYITINGQPSWLSESGDSLIYWNTGSTQNQWTVSASTTTVGLIINNNPSVPPLTGWQVLGNPNINSVTVVTGDCQTKKEILVNVSKSNVICEELGTIIIQANGGVTPYQYSIDNGLTFNTINTFQNLQPGSYSVVVKDSLNNESTPQIVTILQQQAQGYSITLTLDTTNKTFQIQPSSNLPVDEEITFTLAQDSVLKYYPQNLTTVPTYNNVVTLNGGLGGLTLNSTVNNQNVLSLNCSNAPVIENEQDKYYTKTLTISGGQIITGSYTDIINNTPSGNCELATKIFKLYMLNGATLKNCKCCSLKIINPVSLAILKG